MRRTCRSRGSDNALYPRDMESLRSFLLAILFQWIYVALCPNVRTPAEKCHPSELIVFTDFSSFPRDLIGRENRIASRRFFTQTAITCKPHWNRNLAGKIRFIVLSNIARRIRIKNWTLAEKYVFLSCFYIVTVKETVVPTRFIFLIILEKSRCRRFKLNIH